MNQERQTWHIEPLPFHHTTEPLLSTSFSYQRASGCSLNQHKQLPSPLNNIPSHAGSIQHVEQTVYVKSFPCAQKHTCIGTKKIHTLNKVYKNRSPIPILSHKTQAYKHCEYHSFWTLHAPSLHAVGPV
jgi:hypothetical protein